MTPITRAAFAGEFEKRATEAQYRYISPDATYEYTPEQIRQMQANSLDAARLGMGIVGGVSGGVAGGTLGAIIDSLARKRGGGLGGLLGTGLGAAGGALLLRSRAQEPSPQEAMAWDVIGREMGEGSDMTLKSAALLAPNEGAQNVAAGVLGAGSVGLGALGGYATGSVVGNILAEPVLRRAQNRAMGLMDDATRSIDLGKLDLSKLMGSIDEMGSNALKAENRVKLIRRIGKGTGLLGGGLLGGALAVRHQLNRANQGTEQ